MIELGFLMIVGGILAGLTMLLSLVVRLIWFPIKLALIVTGAVLSVVAVAVLLPLSIVGGVVALVLFAPVALFVGAVLGAV